MTLLLDDRTPGPGTHALVIGVGAYPHILGGGATTFPGHEGMTQLTSSPISAVKMTKWFLEKYRSDTRKLRSLDLLVSSHVPTSFRMLDGTDRPVEAATFANAKQAVKAWKGRADSDPANLMVFFFSGHGLARGLQVTLALEDYGSDPDQPLAAAIDFSNLYLGLDLCVARNQVYFVDACRVSSGALLTPSGWNGDPIYYSSRDLTDRLAPIFYATFPGAAAYGVLGGPTVFTGALLEALDGAGSDDIPVRGAWRIQTDCLNRGIDFILRQRVAGTSASDQLAHVEHLTRLAIHDLPGLPSVPVEIACQNDGQTEAAIFSYQGSSGSGRRMPPREGAWRLDLDEGEYDFTADLQPPLSGAGTLHDRVTPPFRPVRIEVR
jgi:hypothetical protein